MVDLVALRALEAVRRTGTVTAAAGELHLTPSAVSHQIKRLERRLDTPLLERVGRLVVLTGEAGRLLDRSGRCSINSTMPCPLRRWAPTAAHAE